MTVAAISLITWQMFSVVGQTVALQMEEEEEKEEEKEEEESLSK